MDKLGGRVLVAHIVALGDKHAAAGDHARGEAHAALVVTPAEAVELRKAAARPEPTRGR